MNFDEIKALKPELLLAYGCSLIKDSLLTTFEGRFINMHLGLSPYYRGSGTNFWPFAKGEPEFASATFMHMASEVDIGEIIHQIRARIFLGDTIHQIGNRLIADMAGVAIKIVRSFERLKPQLQPVEPENVNFYRKQDFSEAATIAMLENFKGDMIPCYLAEKKDRHARSPLVKNSALLDKES